MLDRFVIEDFLSQEDCHSLISACNENAWVDKGGNSRVFIQKTTRHDIIKKIHKSLSEMFDDHYHIQLIRMVHKTDSESFWEEHTDRSDHKVTRDIVYGVIIYLNDDFSGGTLDYSDMSITPKTGMLVCHPGDMLHKVSKVEDGQRYTLTTFIRSKS